MSLNEPVNQGGYVPYLQPAASQDRSVDAEEMRGVRKGEEIAPNSLPYAEETPTSSLPSPPPPRIFRLPPCVFVILPPLFLMPLKNKMERDRVVGLINGLSTQPRAARNLPQARHEYLYLEASCNPRTRYKQALDGSRTRRGRITGPEQS